MKRDEGLIDLITYGICVLLYAEPEGLQCWLSKFYSYSLHKRLTREQKKDGGN